MPGRWSTRRWEDKACGLPFVFLMQQYVAFISGLPVGRDGVKMDVLRSLFSRLGFVNVETFLTTGNVIFESRAVGVIGPLEAQISRHLRKSLGVDAIWTFIRTREDLKRIVADMPFSAEDTQAPGTSLFVILLSEPPDERAMRQLRIRRNDVDELRVNGTEIYWLRRAGAELTPPPPLADMLDAHATVRSFSTIRHLAEGQSSLERQSPRSVSSAEPTESERSRQ